MILEAFRLYVFGLAENSLLRAIRLEKENRSDSPL